MSARTLRLILPAAAFAALAALQFATAQERRTEMTTPCFLIAHPRGTFMWESAFRGDGYPAKPGAFTATKPLLPQLAALGYTPADVTYLALSHYHSDHVANANAFASSNWIVQDVERKAMFAPPDGKAKGLNAPNQAYFGMLEKSKTTLLNSEDHDVFGDGTVVIKFSPGHTRGDQSLFLKLAKTGPVLLSGDLYHYPEELTLKVVPSFDVDQTQTAKSRAAIEDFVKKNNAQLWIQHDSVAGRNGRRLPSITTEDSPCALC